MARAATGSAAALPRWPVQEAHDGSYEDTAPRVQASPAWQPVQYPGPTRPAETSAVRDRVTHDKYGLRVILGVEDDAVLADFSPIDGESDPMRQAHQAVAPLSQVRESNKP
jgi:hypothetical protein